MRIALFALLALLAMASFNCSGAPTRVPADENPWAKVNGPSSGNRGPIGYYSAGCLDGASRLSTDGRGFQLMRLSRNRYWGTLELIDFINRLTTASMNEKVGVLLIGDMSQARGGPMPAPGHASHQIGLDVDVWYWLHPDAQYRPLTPEERESISAISFVDSEKGTVKKDVWRPEQVKMLQIASQQPDSERIFVNAAIKKELCETIPAAKREWLRKLRPWFGHDDHFHVRLKCPPGDAHCTTQEAVPPGDGCDQLAWWFTPEAREAERKAKLEARVLPELPKDCADVLKEARIQPEF